MGGKGRILTLGWWFRFLPLASSSTSTKDGTSVYSGETDAVIFMNEKWLGFVGSLSAAPFVLCAQVDFRLDSFVLLAI